ncbi:MAG: hypothetical protein ACKOGA_21625 [Planctomycetaceae bacterium]
MAQIAPSALTESRVDWAFPIAGGQRTTVTVNVWGRLLEGTTAVWTDSPGIRARIVRVENCPIRIMGRYLGNGQFEDESVQRGQRVELSVEIDQTTEVGGHVMRLVSPRGLSNVLAFRVSPGDEQVVLEDETHACQSNPDQAQRITTIPCSINGRIAGDMLGEVDYYAIDGVAGQEILCELSAGASKPATQGRPKTSQGIAVKKGGYWMGLASAPSSRRTAGEPGRFHHEQRNLGESSDPRRSVQVGRECRGNSCEEAEPAALAASRPPVR